ncbi:hypothetical protein DRQ20_06955 [bacterium]|nr:MAG: hypothetical protein DRQ20_06955 [bacterium]
MIGILLLLLGPFPFISRDYYEGVGRAAWIEGREEECIKKACEAARADLAQNIKCEIEVTTKKILGDSAGKVKEQFQEFVQTYVRIALPTGSIIYSDPIIDKGYVIVKARLSKKDYQEFVEKRMREHISRVIGYYKEAMRREEEGDYTSAVRELMKARAWLFFYLEDLPVEVDLDGDKKKDVEIGGRIDSELDRLLTHIEVKYTKVTYGITGNLRGELKVYMRLNGEPLKYFPVCIGFEKGRGKILNPQPLTDVQGCVKINVSDITSSENEVVLKIMPDLSRLMDFSIFEKEGEVERLKSYLKKKLRSWSIVIPKRKTLALSVYVKSASSYYFPENIYDDVAEIVREKGYDVVKKKLKGTPSQSMLENLAVEGIEYLVIIEVRCYTEYDDYWDVYSERASGRIMLYSRNEI